MNKQAIEKFAVWARKKLISEIRYKLGLLGIMEKGIVEPLPQSTNDLQLFDVGTKNYVEITGIAIKQRSALVNEIKNRARLVDYNDALSSVVEEVAYTWFNRLIAIRFMEVNNYLPSRIRVLSSENAAKNEPDIVTNPFDADLAFSSIEKVLVIQLKDENKLDDLFRMLFIKQCNALHDVLPELFEKNDDYTELLLTLSFTDNDGVVFHLTHDIPEDDFNIEREGQVEIIGWLYQYYNKELKSNIDKRPGTSKINKEDLPVVTQFFTTDWIVRYMVQNSLGRLWINAHPNQALQNSWKYYVIEAEQDSNVQSKFNEIREQADNISPEQIKIIDPSMGSGHVLVYAFEVLMQIYESYGYTQRDAARSILLNNLYGLDIDKRAYQIAYFAIMMKARQYNRRILTEGIQPNICYFKKSKSLGTTTLDRLGEAKSIALCVLDDCRMAEEYGSILNVSVSYKDLTLLEDKLNYIEGSEQEMNILEMLERNELLSVLKPLVKQCKLLVQKYDVLVTNPPYLGIKHYNNKLADYIADNFSICKYDLFSCFMYQGLKMVKKNGYMSMLTQQTWMNIDTFQKFRQYLLESIDIVHLMHLGMNALEGGLGTVAFVFQKLHIENYNNRFVDLTIFDNTELKSQNVFSTEWNYVTKQRTYLSFPKNIISYNISDTMRGLFESTNIIGNHGDSRNGLQTNNNDLFLRYWYEVPFGKIKFGATEPTDDKWFPHIKGGNYRKWYGNFWFVINFENNGQTICNYIDSQPNCRVKSNGRVINREYYFEQGASWSLSTYSAPFSMRFLPKGFIFNIEAPTLYRSDHQLYYMGLLNSIVGLKMLDILSDDVHYKAKDVANVPLIFDAQKESLINNYVKECIQLSKDDWDSFELSWDYKVNPIVRYAKIAGVDGGFDCTHGNGKSPIEYCCELWVNECAERFQKLRRNEEELNRIFIEIYNLHEELTPLVEDENVTVSAIDNKQAIKDFISYAVGCMLGRYSLDYDGIVFAGDEWDCRRYSSFVADADNCIPITDEEYFRDDIVGKFVEFVKMIFGKNSIEENLAYIADTLGNKGKTSREVIRNYFLNNFMEDHIKLYQKRPIYWLFDSGKQDGFKALVYMHRWNADTVGNLRVEYLHKMQHTYEREIIRMQETIDNSRDSREVSKATKRKDKLQKQLKETKDYDAKLAHIALSRIEIDLDDGVKVNYEKVQTGRDGKKMQILAKI